MNKREYLDALKKALEENKVPEIDDILSEYDAHFAHKLADGYSEEEVAARLGKPGEIAGQFLPDRPEAAGGGPAGRGGGKTLMAVGLGFLDLLAFLFFAVMAAWVLVLGAAALGLAAAGASLLSFTALPTFMPDIPAIGRALIGVSAVALAVLAASAAVWFFLFVAQMLRAYRRWHHSLFTGKHCLPLAVTPRLSGKLSRRLRAAVLTSAILFILAFITAYIVMSAAAGSLEFWHVWGWFQ